MWEEVDPETANRLREADNEVAQKNCPRVCTANNSFEGTRSFTGQWWQPWDEGSNKEGSICQCRVEPDDPCLCKEKRCTPTAGVHPHPGEEVLYPASGTPHESAGVSYCFVDEACPVKARGNAHSCNGIKFAFMDRPKASWIQENTGWYDDIGMYATDLTAPAPAPAP